MIEEEARRGGGDITMETHKLDGESTSVNYNLDVLHSEMEAALLATTSRFFCDAA